MSRRYQPRLCSRQAGADPVVRARGAARGEEVAAADRGDVVGHRLGLKPKLDLFKLALWVLVEGDEQHPLILVAGLVEAAVVVVGPAQDSLLGRLGRTWVGKPDVGVERDSLALRVLRVVRVLELGGAPEWRARHAVAADH